VGTAGEGCGANRKMGRAVKKGKRAIKCGYFCQKSPPGVLKKPRDHQLQGLREATWGKLGVERFKNARES